MEGVGTHTENKGHVSLASSQGMPRRSQTCEKARISRTADPETVSGCCRTPLKSGAVRHLANLFKSILLGYETANSNHWAYMYISIQANVERRTTQTQLLRGYQTYFSEYKEFTYMQMHLLIGIWLLCCYNMA